jgi:hypothetical protein
VRNLQRELVQRIRQGPDGLIVGLIRTFIVLLLEPHASSGVATATLTRWAEASTFSVRRKWWAHQDSNLGPTD